MLALIPSFVASILMTYSGNTTVAMPASGFPQSSLKDRCEIARIVASEVVAELDFTRWGGARDNEINLFISKQRTWDAKRELSIFGKNVTCGDFEVGSRYVGERRVKVTLGRGAKGDLPRKKLFWLVRVQSSTARRWELTWKTSESAYVCPKSWEVRGGIDICSPPTRSMVPMPVLRLVLVRGTNGAFSVGSSRLQFLGSNQHLPRPDKDDALSDLPLEYRCKIAREVATGLAMSFAYSRWFGLVGKNITLAIPQPGKSASGQTQPAIFRPGERCDDILTNHWYVLGPSIRVTVANRIAATSPPNREFFSIQSKELETNRWEFSWTFDRGLWTCPKSGEDPYAGECADPTASTVSMPTVRVVMERQSSGELALVSSVLEFEAEEPAVPEAGK